MSADAKVNLGLLGDRPMFDVAERLVEALNHELETEVSEEWQDAYIRARDALVSMMKVTGPRRLVRCVVVGRSADDGRPAIWTFVGSYSPAQIKDRDHVEDALGEAMENGVESGHVFVEGEEGAPSWLFAGAFGGAEAAPDAPASEQKGSE
jgi:hypothetical protein